MMNITVRMTLYARLIQIIAKRMGTAKVRKFAMFKAKKFYISFRPWQKVKSAMNKRKISDEEQARLALERLQSLLYQITQRRLSMLSLVPKNKAKEVESKGIMEVT